MTLHVFNPEHDIALAANLDNFTAPRAGRQLHRDLGFLPMLWAEAGDGVLVDDVEEADASFSQLAAAANECLGTPIVRKGTWLGSGAELGVVGAVSPWGWDSALRFRLRQMGVGESGLPDDSRLCHIRSLSHRRTASRLLALVRDDCPAGTTGVTPVECFSVGEVESAVADFRGGVIKAPWSSSGRGVRFVTVAGGGTPSWQAGDALCGWLRNVICRQGSVMVERTCDKVCDFGMEFEARADGSVAYCGLSLFQTVNGAYTGNILATEQTKRRLMARYVSLEILDRVSESICRRLAVVLQGHYCGPLGVDMMVCRKDGAHGPEERVDEEGCFLVHPCVEINLRRTMGHVALALSPSCSGLLGVMQIHAPSAAARSAHYVMTVSRSALPLRALS